MGGRRKWGEAGRNQPNCLTQAVGAGKNRDSGGVPALYAPASHSCERFKTIYVYIIYCIIYCKTNFLLKSIICTCDTSPQLCFCSSEVNHIRNSVRSSSQGLAKVPVKICRKISRINPEMYSFQELSDRFWARVDYLARKIDFT